MCAVRTVKVWITLCEMAHLIQRTVHYFRALKNTSGKEFECFESRGTAGNPCFVLITELQGSSYEELCVCIVISNLYHQYNKGSVQINWMSPALVRCSIEVDQGGRSRPGR